MATTVIIYDSEKKVKYEDFTTDFTVEDVGSNLGIPSIALIECKQDGKPLPGVRQITSGPLTAPHYRIVPALDKTAAANPNNNNNININQSPNTVTLESVVESIRSLLKDKLPELIDGRIHEAELFTTKKDHPLHDHINSLKIPLSRLGGPDFLMFDLPSKAHLLSFADYGPATSTDLPDGISETVLNLLDQLRVTDVMTASFLFASIIGVSGCGKTRTIYEFLCHRFGLYFVADTEGNGGSRDAAMAKTDIENALKHPELFSLTDATLNALLLARLLVFQICLEYNPEMTPYEWLLVQTSRWTLELETAFRLTQDLGGANCQTATARVLSSLHQKFKYCLPVFVDEAQVFMDSCKSTFPSQSKQGVFRPLFSKVATNFGFHSHMVTIFSGTSLGLKDVKELLTSAIGKELWKGVLFTDLPPFRTFEELDEYFTKFIGKDNITTKIRNHLYRFYLARRRWVPELLKVALLGEGTNIEDLLIAAHNSLLATERRADAPITTIRGKLQQILVSGVMVGAQSLLDILHLLATNYYYIGTTSISSAVSALVQNGFCHLKYRVTGENSLVEAKILEQRVAYALYYFFKDAERPIQDQLANLLHMVNQIDPSAGGFVFERFIVPKVVEWLKLAPVLADHQYFAKCKHTLPQWMTGASVDVATPVKVESARATGMTLLEYYQLPDADFVFIPAHSDRHDAVFRVRLLDGTALLVFCQWKFRKDMPYKSVESALRTLDPFVMTQAYTVGKRKRAGNATAQALLQNVYRVDTVGHLQILLTTPAIAKDDHIPDVCSDEKVVFIAMDKKRTREALTDAEWNTLFLAKQ